MLFNFVGRGKLVTTDVNFQMYLHVRLNPIHAMYCLPSYRRKHSQGLEICYTILDFFFLRPLVLQIFILITSPINVYYICCIIDFWKMFDRGIFLATFNPNLRDYRLNVNKY